MDPAGNTVGFIAEEENLFTRMLVRQLARTHRPFTTHVFDKYGIEVLRVRDETSQRTVDEILTLTTVLSSVCIHKLSDNSIRSDRSRLIHGNTNASPRTRTTDRWPVCPAVAPLEAQV